MSEFEPATENAALKQAIVREIDARDGITFRDFMEMALYHPNLGYYTTRRDKIGRSGDYVTSPEASAVFGAIVGRQLREMWQRMGEPPSWTLVECGAGTGALARDILRWAARAASDFRTALHYVIVEASTALAERQRETLEAEGLSGEWHEEIRPGVTGCIFSNELLDALPVHRVTVVHGLLKEVYVTWTDGQFIEDLRPPSVPDIERYFADLDLRPGVNCYAEVNLAARDWVRSAAAALDHGYLMTFDYGYEASDLYANWRTDGTLMCFYKHNPSHDPYARIGRQDITSHVDFTTVRRSGEAAGLTTVGRASQSEFLANLGVADASAPPTESETGLEEYFARRNEVVELIDPADLGRIKVLCQARGVPADLTGFRGHA